MSGSKTLGEFLNTNSGILTVLGIFLIFLFEGSHFLTNSSKFPLIDLISQHMWFAGILIVMFCLGALIRTGSQKDNAYSIAIFTAIAFLLFVLLSLYLCFSIFLGEVPAVKEVLILTPKSIFISVIVILSPLPVLYFNNKKLGKLRWITNIALSVIAVVGLLTPIPGVAPLLMRLGQQSVLAWLSLGLLASYIVFFTGSLWSYLKRTFLSSSNF